jgi:hypothetical protein
MPSESHPQVILFGSIRGDWREQHIIPVLDELGVSYFNPITGTEWTEEMGRREGEVMAHCKTVVMVFNDTSPAFGGLTEAGWAALGSHRRQQTFILCVQTAYTLARPWWVRLLPGAGRFADLIEEYAQRCRFLVLEHARHLAEDDPRLIVVDTIDEVADALRRLYASG